MPQFVLKPKISSSSNLVLLSGVETQIRSEVNIQLSGYKHLTVLNGSEFSSDLDNIFPVIFIYFAPFSFYRKKDTKYINNLLSLLQTALKYNSRFVLVLNDNSLLSRQVLQYTLQFIRQKSLAINIVNVDHGVTPKTMAQLIIRLFIYNHHLTNDSSSLNSVFPSKMTDILSINRSGMVKKKISGFLLYSVAIILGYFISILVQVNVIKLFINHGFDSFIENDYLQSSRQFYIASSVSDALVSNAKILIPGYYIDFILGIPVDKTINVIKSFSDFTQNLSGIDQSIYNLIYTPGTDSVKTNLSGLKSDFSLFESYIASLKTNIVLADKSYLRFRVIPDSLINNISSLEALTPKLNYLIPQFPQLLGYGKPITYLFLLQDNSRLFPTGGEVDSVVILSLVDGRVSNFQIHSSSDLDQLFPGTPTPPLDYQRLMGKFSWPVSQTNWNPDFSVTADVVAKYISKALGVKPDVVIGLNLLTLKNVIPSLKHLTFSVNGSFLTPDNFINKYLEFADGKPNTSFTREALSHIQYQSPVFTPDSFGIFLHNIFYQLDLRQIFIQPTGSLLPPNNPADWSGQINAPGCRSYWPCLQGFLYISDARLSDNPSYFLLSQKNTLDILISQDTADYNLKTAVTNTEDAKNTQPSVARLYRAVFLPANIQLLSASINNKASVPDRPQFIKNSKIQQLGFSLNIPAQTESILEIRYRQFLPQNNNKFRLQIDIPNQPGLIDSSYDINVIYPPSWFATSFQKPLVASPGTLRYNTPISQPIHLDIDFFKR